MLLKNLKQSAERAAGVSTIFINLDDDEEVAKSYGYDREQQKIGASREHARNARIFSGTQSRDES